MYFTGIVAGAAVQGILALIIIGRSLDAYKLSRRSEKENLNDLTRDEERLKPRSIKPKVIQNQEKPTLPEPLDGVTDSALSLLPYQP